MSMQEINPEHSVTKEMHDLWYKIVGVLIHKYKLGVVRITPQDMDSFANVFNGKLPCVMVQSNKGQKDLVLELVDEDKARLLAAGDDFFRVVDGQNRGSHGGSTKSKTGN